MDSIVRRAMAKWPNVPAAYGWLSLDRRGRWRVGGQVLSHRPSVEFINRNYHADALGRWYFQNGPQRVFVDLAYTPWIYSLQPNGGLIAHTGIEVAGTEYVLVDEHGSVLVLTELGVGVLDDRDLASLGDAWFDRFGQPVDDIDLDALAVSGNASGSGLMLRLGATELEVAAIASSEVASRFGYIAHPHPPV